jgi:hypothetical protein
MSQFAFSVMQEAKSRGVDLSEIETWQHHSNIVNGSFKLEDWLLFTEKLDEALKKDGNEELYNIVREATVAQGWDKSAGIYMTDVDTEAQENARIKEIMSLLSYYVNDPNFTQEDAATVIPLVEELLEFEKGGADGRKFNALDPMRDQLNVVVDRVNQLEDPATGEKYNLQKFRVGIENVPRDMLAMLHQGESVWTKAQTTNVAGITSQLSSALIDAQSLVTAVGNTSQEWINLDHVIAKNNSYVPIADDRLDEMSRTVGDMPSSQSGVSASEIVTTIITQTDITNKLLAEIKSALPSSSNIFDKMRSADTTVSSSVIQLKPTIGLYKPL